MVAGPGDVLRSYLAAGDAQQFDGAIQARSGSRGALLRPGPLRTVRARHRAHGSSKPVRVGRVWRHPSCDGPRSVHRRSGVQLVLGFSRLTNLIIWLT